MIEGVTRLRVGGDNVGRLMKLLLAQNTEKIRAVVIFALVVAIIAIESSDCDIVQAASLCFAY